MDVFSVGKAMAAVCVLILAEDGSVDLDAPVSRYWPQFAAAGKGGVTVGMLLSHRAGVPAVRHSIPDAAIFDWTSMAAALAAEEPWWDPGTTHGYHVNTFGFLTGELVRRVGGESIGAFFGAASRAGLTPTSISASLRATTRARPSTSSARGRRRARTAPSTSSPSTRATASGSSCSAACT